MDPSLQPNASFSLQERAIATDMLAQKIGGAVLNFALQDGRHVHQETSFKDSDFIKLTDQFRRDPKNTLAVGREDLFAIAGDSRLKPEDRINRTAKYLDAYLALTLKLDNSAFPADRVGRVRTGIPSYLPDGFVDMGKDDELNPARRSREQIVLDKAAIFDKYREDLIKIFSNPQIIGANNDDRKRLMASALASTVYFKMPYAYDEDGKPASHWGGGNVNLSNMDEGVCRHQALAFQTLAQAVGLTSILFKNRQSTQEQDGTWGASGSHVANLIRVNSKWYILDVTQPDYKKRFLRTVWQPGVIAIDSPPKEGQVKEYTGTLRHSGTRKKYTSRHDSHWRIDRVTKTTSTN